MRYIGNKTRLLPFILRTLKRSGIGVGSVHDAFAGTASVSRALKEKGWRVHSSDLLMSSYVFQRAYVVAEAADPLLGDMARDLSALPPREAFISEHFSPSVVAAREQDVLHSAKSRIDAARESGSVAESGEIGRTANTCFSRRYRRRGGSPIRPAFRVLHEALANERETAARGSRDPGRAPLQPG